ncbi:hypothetical protein DAEQUDRAFT_755185 [Daedalea quercina L-15889]|uniref:Bromo domain-containing protein n=1 Tax=Daedalea quercina L-15889 TaxID=1314783 RepID=A0A165SQL2_9APHY|nr:hypothetical protein DAEQUDRAFT_755185 [Daedalea quercina L-15889]
MNNLLRTLTESQVRAAHQHTDLKLLLSAVKETRKQSHDAAKLADAFYDSLEGLLHDLRMVTMDNRDAEAFLKPVSRTDVPDYYDVISNPMDLQTMHKRVKQKQYKSKRDFKDDLELIWSNCFTYNAQQDHPLRMCAMRLKTKAEKLLKNITDYKERADPVIPSDIAAVAVAPRTNGVTTNGHTHLHSHSPALIKSPSPGKTLPMAQPSSKKARHDGSFADSPAIVRSAEGMAAFMHLDQELEWWTGASHPANSASDEAQHLEQRLRQYVPVSDDETGIGLPLQTIDGDVGEKRKLNGFLDDRPRKRVRMSPSADKDPVELWWDAMQCDELLRNGLPTLLHRSSSDVPGAVPPAQITDPPRQSTQQSKKKKKKKAAPRTNTLLYHMNNNIRTLRRVRTTHAKFAALSQNQNAEEGGGPVAPAEPVPDDVVDVLDERPWKPIGSGIEVGEEHANDCLHWMGSKVLEHAGFQGTSKAALDVLAGVASEYLLNVGRTIRFMCDKYAKKMTPEEIILHTLFESGTTRIYELDRYVKDDVIRYGGRLTDLEKKLANAYRDATTEEAWDDDALFHNAEDEEEDGQFVMGNFADSFGEDFLGLRELGIAAEFGLQSLTIPKKLLKSKRQGQAEGPSTAKPTEPPPPFPPPPPFVPLDSRMVENQIGLLKPFYHERISTVSAPAAQPPPPGAAVVPRPPAALPPPPGYPQPIPAPPDTDTPVVLPDDAPSPSHTKTGPLGQIMKNAPSTATSKKKKAKASVAPMGMAPAPSEGDLQQDFATPGAESPKKGQSSGGSTAKKKPINGPGALPAVIMANA